MPKKYFSLDDFPKKQEGKLNIYMHISENSGVGYYRQYLPALALRDAGLANVMISDFRWGEGDHAPVDNEILFAIANWADIIIVGRQDRPEVYANWGGIRQFFNVPIIMDTDDNVRHVRPTNPGYQGYHPGADALMWNKYGMAKVFDAITVSTQDLVDFHKKENNRIYLCANRIDLKAWDAFPKPEHDTVRIGFLASSAHSDGAKMISKPVIEILKKHPNVEFYVTGAYKPFFIGKGVDEQIKEVPWIKLQEWPQKVKELGLDIGLAPLTDNMFNRAKSNLRWMEYSSCSMAVIASPVKPYLCINHEKDGYLANNEAEWLDYMEKLVVDKDLRYTMGKEAHERIEREFEINKNAHVWLDAYKEVHQKFHEFFGKKKEFILAKDGKKKKYIEVK